MAWVAAASAELEENATAQRFLGAASKGKVSMSNQMLGGGAPAKAGHRKSYHPEAAPLRTALIDCATKEVRSVIFTGVPPISAIHDAVKSLFKWDDCTVLDPEAETPIVNDDMLDSVVGEWEEREVARHADEIEAKLESMRSKLASHTIEAREVGCQVGGDDSKTYGER